MERQHAHFHTKKHASYDYQIGKGLKMLTRLYISLVNIIISDTRTEAHFVTSHLIGAKCYQSLIVQ